jgi:hypothetical protein
MFEESSVCADSRVDGKEQEDGEFAISRNYFDFEGIGPIESDVEPCDEVQAFCDLVKDTLYHGKKRALNDMFNQILTFYAVKAYDVNLSAGEMKVSDYALKMVATYKDLVDNLSLMDDFRDVFFSKWSNSKLPDDYAAWVQVKFENGKNGKEDALNAWVAKEAPRYASDSKEVKLKLYFGILLIQKATDVSQPILRSTWTFGLRKEHVRHV